VVKYPGKVPGKVFFTVFEFFTQTVGTVVFIFILVKGKSWAPIAAYPL